MAEVSIIIPVYNAERFLCKCIDSVLSQTFEGWEMILVNDGSKDSSLAICKEYAEKNKRIKVLDKPNGGPSSARNSGLREAKGEYVFFLDADDTITPDCIELLYGLAKQHDADYVQGKYQSSCLHEGWEVQKVQEVQDASLVQKRELPSALSDRREIKRLLLNHNKIQFTPHNRLVRRQMIIDNGLFFNEEIKVREDFLWMTFVAKYVKCFAYCDKPTYYRGYNEDSLTNNINREREIQGYRVLIETMVANYDSFQLGYQKELALEALMMALRTGYYHDEAERRHLVDVVASKNNRLENMLLRLYLKTQNSKLLHLLVRMYKIGNNC
jgi:glycosyltransferase involved in cell wall biosynthesis